MRETCCSNQPAALAAVPFPKGHFLQEAAGSQPAPAFGSTFPGRGTKLLVGWAVKACSVVSVLLADDAPLRSQAGSRTEHGEAEASSGSQRPETQSQGAGSTQPARCVCPLLVELSPKPSHAPPSRSTHLGRQRYLYKCEDAFCSMGQSSRWDNLAPSAAKDSLCGLRQFS